MSTTMTPADSPELDPTRDSDRKSIGRRIAEHPHLVLIAVLIVLILLTGLIEPNYLSFRGLRNSALFAVPIGILAAGQTILMLTGGIDLSIGGYTGEKGKGRKPIEGLAGELSPQRQEAFENESIKQMVDKMIADHGVDPTRVFLSGHSMGGDAAWDIGLSHRRP